MPKGLSFDLINEALTKKVVSNLIHVCYRSQELKETVIFADQMMYMGFEYSTKSGISFCSNDMIIPSEKAEMIEKQLLKLKTFSSNLLLVLLQMVSDIIKLLIFGQELQKKLLKQ